MYTENVCLLVCSLAWWTIYDGFTPALQPANLRGERVLRRQARQQSISRALSSKPAAATCGGRIMGQTDGQTDGRSAVS